MSLNKSAQLRVLFSFSLIIVSRPHVIIRHIVELASLLLASAVDGNQRRRVSEALTDVLQVRDCRRCAKFNLGAFRMACYN